MLEYGNGTKTLGEIIALRRGSIGDLHTTTANLKTAIPVIDLVNESLEALGTDVSTGRGAIYDTNSESLAGFTLPADQRDSRSLGLCIKELLLI